MIHVRTRNDERIHVIIILYFLMYSTDQNPHGCCDGYLWDSVVDNCVGMYSVLTYPVHFYSFLIMVCLKDLLGTLRLNVYWTRNWSVFFFQNAVRDIVALGVSLLVLIHCMEKTARTNARVPLLSIVILCLGA